MRPARHLALALTLALFASAPVSAASITGFSVRPEGDKVFFDYTVESQALQTFVILLIKGREKTFTPGELHLTGDVGLVEPGGEKSILWDVGRDFPEGYTGPVEGEMSALDVVVDIVTGMKLVYVEGNCFEMGCATGHAACDQDEKPVENVCLDPLYMGLRPVTNTQYALYLDDTPSARAPASIVKRDGRFVPAAGQGNAPVTGIDWFEARDYAAWLSSKTGLTYRLPGEAEWEYACRSKGQWHLFGTATGELPGDLAAGKGMDAIMQGPSGPNLLGLRGMSGGVWEWVGSAYAPYGVSDDPAPDAPKVLRGGRNGGQARHARCANRYPRDPKARDGNVGFRLVRLP